MFVDVLSSKPTAVYSFSITVLQLRVYIPIQFLRSYASVIGCGKQEIIN